MAKQYQWRTVLNITQGGYPNEPHGVVPPDTGWRTEDDGSATRTNTASYYYVDSDVSSPDENVNASKVTVGLTETWTASYDDLNTLTIRVNTVITSIDRVLSGNAGSSTRDIRIYDSKTGPLLWSKDNDALSTHNILTNLVVDSRTITVAPGGTYEASSLRYWNHSHGMPEAEPYVDEMDMGVQFKNTQPAPTDYRLSYSANGGSGAPSAQTAYEVSDSHQFTIPNGTPSWIHHIFLGWSFNQSATTPDYQAGDTITLSKNDPQKTLYAVWEYTYRPGKRYIQSSDSWVSHNYRNGGHADIRANNSWVEMRTRANKAGLEDPPVIRRNGAWISQALIGDHKNEGE